MEYCVNTTCQFRGRLYEKNEIVDFPAEVETPPYFDALTAPVSDEGVATHTMHEELGEATKDAQSNVMPENEVSVQDAPTPAKRGRKK